MQKQPKKNTQSVKKKKKQGGVCMSYGSVNEIVDCASAIGKAFGGQGC
jgi:hypothetical protein